MNGLSEEVGGLAVTLLILAQQAQIVQSRGIRPAGTHRQSPFAFGGGPIAPVRIDHAEVGVDQLCVGLRFECAAIKDFVGAPVAIPFHGEDGVEAADDYQSERYALPQENAASGSRFALGPAPELCGSPSDQPTEAN